MKLTFKQLNLFVAIAHSGSLSQGAKKVFLSQPAASVALAELERRLGQPLFDRLGKRLVLNSNGLQLFPKAVELIERLNLTEQLFENKSLELSGTLKIGTSMTIGNYIAAPLIAQFMQAHPKVHLVQKVANSETIIQELEKFQLDIGFIEDECFSENLLAEKWGEDELVVFSSPAHPLAQSQAINVKELAQAEWVMREQGSGTRHMMEKYIRPKNIRVEVGSTPVIKQIVATSNCLGCVSRYALENEFKEKTLTKLTLKKCLMKRDFLQVIHREKYQTALIRMFMEEFDFSSS